MQRAVGSSRLYLASCGDNRASHTVTDAVAKQILSVTAAAKGVAHVGKWHMFITVLHASSYPNVVDVSAGMSRDHCAWTAQHGTCSVHFSGG